MMSHLFAGRVARFLTTQPTIRLTMLNFGDSANLFLLCQLNSTLSFLFYDSVNTFPYNTFILKAFFTEISNNNRSKNYRTAVLPRNEVENSGKCILYTHTQKMFLEVKQNM